MKNLKRSSIIRWLIVFSLLPVLTIFLTCTKNDQDVIMIGHIAPLTGDAAIWGNWEVEGIDLAVELINSKGGIHGKKIIILREDDQANPNLAVSAIQKLITVNGVKVVIGATLSSTTLAIAPIAEKNKVVLISPSAQSPKISEAGDYIFRIFVSSTVEGKYMADLANKFQVTSSAILYLNNDYGLGLRNVLHKLLPEVGIDIVSDEKYNSDTRDYRSYIEKLKSISPDVVFLLGYPTDMGTILIQMREMGFKSKIIAPDSFEADEIIDIAKGSADSVFYVYPILPDVGNEDLTRQKFKDQYNKEMNIYNAMGYDAVNLLVVALGKIIIRKEEIEGEAIKDELYAIKDFPGLTGYITFDKNGDVEDRPMEVRLVVGDSFHKFNDGNK